MFGLSPSQITGEVSNAPELDLGFIDNITELIRTVGIFIAVGALMFIGIKYVMGSIEEKATYKKSMMPYIIGCFVLFGAAILAPELEETFKNIGTDTETIGNSILGIIQTLATVITVGVLMVLGIRYMMGSAGEKAEYKRTMVPYIVGVILIFAAVSITSAIYGMVTEEEKGEEGEESVETTLEI